MEIKPINLPQDELPHNNIIEWWYFNGHLTDEKGNRYAFMDCLFRANPKKVNIPFLKMVPFKNAYFSHALLSEVEHKKFHSEINPIVLLSQDSFTKELFFANYTHPSLSGYFNHVMERLDDNQYHLKTRYFDLILKSKKPPMLVGKTGYLDLGKNSTYYYSLTNLETEGEIIIAGRRIKVKGKSWMDHQWADAAYSSFKWTWFSLQLENNTEIVCFRFEDKGKITNLASLISPSRQSHYSQVDFIPLGEVWQSSKTGTEYPLSWKIIIPEIKAEIEVSPLVQEQEMIFGPINYWEGGLEVKGRIGGQEVSGVGFMELVGYPVKKGRINFYQQKLKNQIKLNLKNILGR